jgi:hypothetical protein
MTEAKEMLARLEEKIDRSGGAMACHPWLGALTGGGVPTFWFGNKPHPARRRFWECQRGPLTDKRLVWTSCGNRQCMNLRHLYIKPQKDPAARFWRCVLKKEGDGCWEWVSNRSKAGHGSKRARQRGEGYGYFMFNWETKMLAHRYSWELHHGPIPKGMLVCHRCDNPPCVRPDHLFLGTYKDNAHDMVAKGRAGHFRPDFGERIRLGHAKRKAVGSPSGSEGER